MTLNNNMFEETTKILKDKYLNNKDELDSKKKRLAKRNDRAYPGFIKKQKELIRNRDETN
ncbi:hypothetical protein 8014-B2_00112 [Lactobacillus phage ATCC 8014-B2]|uniref:Uncharacterized protein n=1 Tax=Lactobacillus phage ATCC 8014-B2 TaxID=1225795 RepID=K4IDB8_9CAUD|nr:hypothetical protein HOQ89_gp034 [Lactobacillus phage ATCC 8014-B2]AFU63179.1 hypothetical protein 8014-B2_00112 [Lactobacillus phage ATCC 8014-B2]